MSNVDKATMTFFWDGTLFETTAGTTAITELKMSDAPDMAKSTSTQAQTHVTSTNVPARYLRYFASFHVLDRFDMAHHLIVKFNYNFTI